MGIDPDVVAIVSLTGPFITEYGLVLWDFQYMIGIVGVGLETLHIAVTKEVVLQIVRIYTGDDGESHFEDLNHDQLADIVARTVEGSVNLMRRNSPLYSGSHTAPRRQYVVVLEGVIVEETGDGTRKYMAAGDVLVAEDLIGRGHRSLAVDDQPRVTISIPFTDNNAPS